MKYKTPTPYSLFMAYGPTSDGLLDEKWVKTLWERYVKVAEVLAAFEEERSTRTTGATLHSPPPRFDVVKGND